MNEVIADNIADLLKKRNIKQIQLAEALGTNKQTVSKMLNGSRTINAFELKQIAEFLHIKMEELTKLPKCPKDRGVVHVFMGRVESEEAKKALEIADTISDMIIFHNNIKQNGEDMQTIWSDDDGDCFT